MLFLRVNPGPGECPLFQPQWAQSGPQHGPNKLPNHSPHRKIQVCNSRGDSGGTGPFIAKALLFVQMINKSIGDQNPPDVSLASLSIFPCDVIRDVTCLLSGQIKLRPPRKKTVLFYVMYKVSSTMYSH